MIPLRSLVLNDPYVMPSKYTGPEKKGSVPWTVGGGSLEQLAKPIWEIYRSTIPLMSFY